MISESYVYDLVRDAPVQSNWHPVSQLDLISNVSKDQTDMAEYVVTPFLIGQLAPSRIG